MTFQKPFSLKVVIAGNWTILALALYKAATGAAILCRGFAYEQWGRGVAISGEDLYSGSVLLFKWGIVSIPMCVVTLGLMKVKKWARIGHVIFFIPAAALLFPFGIIYYWLSFYIMVFREAIRNAFEAEGG